ncbi:hypothetical protein OB955_00615 [Halobacteria archaeon AArc-m2/3/4]|uniref:DUF8097 domain-containing protein n=1 Tax=Natronoglomus mannanivorans TaxID=2979990 RepID=A0AAP2YYZ8_9EURY|nr:hypothetical protein [Halobacteria archaeon AArc-xg1-1]MCU4971240.1 hypothetical protein [Halobacteria archaeon AArc-m2/3/4]
MERHWSKIALDLLSSVLTLVSISYLWRRTRGESPTISPGWLLAGVGSTVGSRLLYDRNAMGIRNHRGRRLAFYGVHAIVARRLLPDDDTVTYNVAIGSALGTIVSLLWNDVLRPVLE